jgi:hypothetical protein
MRVPVTANGVTERNTAAQLARTGNCLYGKGLVQFDVVKIGHGEIVLGEDFTYCQDWPQPI